MYYVYIIKSQNHSRYYTGYTNNITDRLEHHNSGATKSTKPYRPWILVYTEQFKNKKLAWLREKQIKKFKGGEAFKKLVNSHGEVA